MPVIISNFYISIVNGGWSSWTTLTSCVGDNSCSQGDTYKRTRVCDSPAPFGNGDSCPGNDTQFTSAGRGPGTCLLPLICLRNEYADLWETITACHTECLSGDTIWLADDGEFVSCLHQEVINMTAADAYWFCKHTYGNEANLVELTNRNLSLSLEGHLRFVSNQFLLFHKPLEN